MNRRGIQIIDLDRVVLQFGRNDRQLTKVNARKCGLKVFEFGDRGHCRVNICRTSSERRYSVTECLKFIPEICNGITATKETCNCVKNFSAGQLDNGTCQLTNLI